MELLKLQEYFEYLDELRDSGVTNMFGAGPYLQRDCNLEKKESHKVLKLWMDTFSDEPVYDRALKAFEKEEYNENQNQKT